MPKTIALAQYNQKLANELAAQGFHIVDSTYPCRSGQTADACLYTSYRPDTDTGFTPHPGHADICLGNYHYTITDHPATIHLNITGLTIEQIADKLHRELAHCPRL